jgi:hypothetical protein
MFGLRWGLLGGVVVGLGVLTLACGPSAVPATPGAPTPDPFAVVRATSQAAYQSGRALVDRGDRASLVQGCTLIDTAKTTDPDDRPDVNQALDQCKAALSALLATEAPTPAAALQTLVLPTLPASTGGSTSQATLAPRAGTPEAGSGSVASASGTAGVPTGGTGPRATPGTAPQQATSGTSQQQATPGATAAGSLVTWRDPQRRFSISAPSDWATTEQPQTLFGTGVVAFREPAGRAEVDVSVDNATRAVSPELYAATMELVMSQQVPGYAGEQVVPGATSGNPSVRRVFTFTVRDANGRDIQARGFQVALLKGSTPYIISGSAPADQFQQYSPTFDRVVASFQFS